MEVPEAENAILMDQGGSCCVPLCVFGCVSVCMCVTAYRHTHSSCRATPLTSMPKQAAVYGDQAHRGSWEVKDCHPQKVSNHPSELIACTSEKPLPCVNFKFSSGCLLLYEPSYPCHRLPPPTLFCLCTLPVGSVCQRLTDNPWP